MIEFSLVQYRIERSKEALRDARTLIDAGGLNAAVNRLYYCMFYAVTALLKTHGLVSSKHSGVRALFNLHFIKTGIVTKEAGQFYSELFDRRMKGDYVDYTEFSPEQVAEYYDKTALFTALIIEMIETITSESK